MAEIQVKGTVLRGFLKDIKTSYPKGIPGFLELIPEEPRSCYFAQRIMHVGWYPYAALVLLLDTYYEHVGRRNRRSVFELGARGADRDLGSTLQVMTWLTKPHIVGQRAQSVWKQKYNRGEMTVAESWDDGFRLELTEFPEVHHLNCELICGYIQGFGLRWRKTFSAKHDRCVHRRDPLCSFVASW
jgi:hypothetical protein